MFLEKKSMIFILMFSALLTDNKEVNSKGEYRWKLAGTHRNQPYKAYSYL